MREIAVIDPERRAKRYDELFSRKGLKLVQVGKLPEGGGVLAIFSLDLDLIARAVAAGLQVIVVVREEAPARAIASAANTGAKVLIEPLEEEDLKVFLPARQEKLLYLVCGAKGGVGTSTIAVNVAAALARTGVDTTVVDMAVGFGGSSKFLSSPAPFTLTDLLDAVDRLESDMIQEAAVKIEASLPASLRLIASPQVFSDVRTNGYLKFENVEKLVRKLLETSSVVMDIDVSARWGCFLELAPRADRLFLVTSQDFASVYNLSELLTEVLRFFDRERVVVVLNRARNYEKAFRFIQKKLGFEPQVVPHDQEFDDALARGVPLIIYNSKSKAAESLMQLLPHPVRRKKSWWFWRMR